MTASWRRRMTVSLVLGAASSSAVLTADPPEALAHQTTPARREVERDVAAGRESRVVRIAMKHRGAPYVWGGASPVGFDCSGFVTYVYAKVGVSLPHNAAQQYRYGTPVPKADLRPGDLVFFDRLRHNGIYIGHGRIIHATRQQGGVKVSRLDEPWLRTRWVAARRLSSTMVAANHGE